MTPSRIEMLGSPSTSSEFTSRRVPTPWQSGQAPNGELNENCLGSSSGSDRPQTGQAKRSEKTTDSADGRSAGRAEDGPQPGKQNPSKKRPDSADGRSAGRGEDGPPYRTTSTTPSAVFNAVSIE